MLPVNPLPPRQNSKKWTEEEDRLLLDGIARYNAENPLTKFPEDPFSERLKTHYLKLKDLIPELDRSRKQIRQRYINNLSPKVLTKIADEDKERILALQEKYGNIWSKISEITFREFFKEKNYYGENLIKNFYHSNLRRESFNKKHKSSDSTDQGPESITYITSSEKIKSSKRRKILLEQTRTSSSSAPLFSEENRSIENLNIPVNQKQTAQPLSRFSNEEVLYIQRVLLFED